MIYHINSDAQRTRKESIHVHMHSDFIGPFLFHTLASKRQQSYDSETNQFLLLSKIRNAEITDLK